jgi:hypothetical protein
MASKKLIVTSVTSRDVEFRESNLYHTPRRDGKRKPPLVSTPLCCLLASVTLIGFILVITAVAVRYSGAHHMYRWLVTIGDTELIPVDSYFCQQVCLTIDDRQTGNTDGSAAAAAKMILLDRPPPLDGTSSVTIKADFHINEFKEYIDDYGWYDYNYEINYVTWSFQLYKGSMVAVEACIDSESELQQVLFAFIKGKADYDNFKRDQSFSESKIIPSCDGNNSLKFDRNINENGRYYMIFQTDDEADNTQSFVNATLKLNRKEYSIDDVINAPNCTTRNNAESCTLPIPFTDYPYVLLQTFDTTNSVQAGTTMSLEWECDPRIWVYVVLLFFLPFLSLCVLLTAMFCCYNHLTRNSNSRLYSEINSERESGTLVYGKHSSAI